MYDNLDKENKKIELLLEKLPLTMQFIEKRNDIDHSTLYSFDGPFQLLQADIAYISFSAKSAGDPKLCLLFVNLFTSKIYTFPMKTRNLLAKKMEQFYNDIQKKRSGKRMRLQTDQEFKQRKIYDLNKKFNVDMFTKSLRGGKAFAAEQKIREFKKFLLRSKRIEKYNKERIKPNALIKKATVNVNNVKPVKYGFAPEQIEEKSLNKETGKEFTEIYDFHRLIKVKENKDRIQRHNLKIDSRKKRLRSPLETGEKVFVLSEHLKKKDASGKFYESSTENKTFFNRDRIFTIINRRKINDQGFIYWIKESNEKINGRFLRQELYALNNQFIE